ncbi:MAG: L-seryl-tRNA(Sec) selenium transferase [Armatimonadota bacterium]
MTLRDLPRVDSVLAHPAVTSAARAAPRDLVKAAVREALAEARACLKADHSVHPSLDSVAERAVQLLGRMLRRSLRRCINATGVVLHTGLGRAPLSSAATEALNEVAGGYSNLQADVGSGERTPREVHVEGLLQQLTGAESAVVVNNNAAATVLVLNSLAAGREVIISRGEMVEIGGAFRLPDIVALSGCRLVEVGCTNRTHLRDYRRALSPNTALILAVHQSNYRITGFTAQASLPDLVALAREAGVACAHDLGSGALVDLSQFGLPREPTVQDSLAAGCEVVLFSGDKLLGGPQCGIIVGKRAVVEPMRANPYYRTFRVDKLTLSALEATLRLFLDPDSLLAQHRVLAMLTLPADDLRKRAEALAARIATSCASFMVVATPVESEVGGGSLAGHTLPSWAVSLASDTIEAGDLSARLRGGDPPVFGRVHAGCVLLDLRTVLPEEDDIIVAAVARAAPSEESA